MQAIIKRRNNYKKLIYIIYSISILNITSLLNIYFINSNPTFAANSSTFDANITIKPSLTLDISTNKISMELNPSSKPFDEQDIVVSVGTNNTYGYKLYVSTDNNSTDLINIADNTKTLPNLTSTYSIDNFPVNYWGYRLTQNNTVSSGDYGIFTSGSIISQSDKPVNNITSTLGFASKIDYTKPSGTYELTLNFKALPVVTQYYMQNLDLSVCTEDPTVVIDKRDNQTYTISRLKDGKCWMTQNLKLGKYSDSIALTQADSNVSASGFVLEGKSADGKFEEQKNITQYYCDDSYGCYYNWWTSTAGTNIFDLPLEYDAKYSICPSGWMLPSKDEYNSLLAAYNNNKNREMTIDVVENINGQGMPGFTLGGHYYDRGAVDIGLTARYWTRTSGSNAIKTAAKHFVLDYGNYQENLVGDGYYVVGRSLRCILTEN